MRFYICHNLHSTNNLIYLLIDFLGCGATTLARGKIVKRISYSPLMLDSLKSRRHTYRHRNACYRDHTLTIHSIVGVFYK